MTAAKVTVRLDPAVARRARQDVADGKAKSVSAWLNDAARARLEGEDLAAVVADLFEDTGGLLTEQEVAHVRARLALPER
jgi:predicted transcriptional regulator